ncbi:MAG: response regulator, partial [Myxococcota bacterium]
VRAAADPREALAIWIHEGPFDLLVTDLEMPHMRGPTLAHAVRITAAAAPVLYVSASPPTGMGAHERCLAKPFTEARLSETVREFLAAR